MLSGRRLDLLQPQPADIEIADIAHGLARVARWNGQTAGPAILSVAQHSVLVEALASRLDAGLSAADRLAALLHDGPEYVIGDLISPFKAVLSGSYKVVEHRLLDAIHARFDLPPCRPALAELIKAADRIAAHFEATQLAGFDAAEADTVFGPPPASCTAALPALVPAGSAAAEAAFLDRFAILQRQRTAAGG